MKRIILLLFCLVAYSAALQAQTSRVKFQNNRFANIKVQPVKLINANDFYSDYLIDEKLQKTLSKIFTKADLEFILESAHESVLPEALNSFDKRNKNREKMKYLNLYQLCTFTNGERDISILVAPLSENAKAKPADMIGDNDMILFFNTSAIVETSSNNSPGESVAKKGYSCDDYSQAIVDFFDSGIKIGTPYDSIPLLLPAAVAQRSGFDFKEEYVYTSGRNGLKEVTIVCDSDGDKPLYEVIFEFDNADSTRELAWLMFGDPNHPQLDDYWVLGVAGENAVSLAWTFNNKLVIACNLPGTEMEDSEDFILSDEYIAKFNGTESTGETTNTTNSDTDDNEATSLVVNNLILAAINDFDDYKTELMPYKAADYNAAAYVQLGQEQAVVRKNAAGNWRLEVRFAPYSTSEEARNVLDNTISFYQALEGLEYRLVEKSDLSTTNGRTIIWDIQTMDDVSTGIILKWQSYPAIHGKFGIKMELGK